MYLNISPCLPIKERMPGYIGFALYLGGHTVVFLIFAFTVKKFLSSTLEMNSLSSDVTDSSLTTLGYSFGIGKRTRFRPF
jgi:hypothetical protein